MKFRQLAILGLSAALLFTGCSKGTDSGNTDTSGDQTSETEDSEEDTKDDSSTDEAEKELFAMDTYMTLTAYGENAQDAVDAAAEEIERLDAMLSTGSADSEIGQVNANGSGTLSEESGYLVERSLELYQETDGVFDIAIYPIMQAWGFTDQNYQVPSADTLQGLLPLTDASEIVYDADTREISFGQEGMKIDLGGIAKGYTSSRIMDIYREHGIESGMVNLGGNVQVLGTKTDGSNWRVAIQNPDDENDYLGVLETADKAVITSGGYERYFEQDGKTYHHIIDPSTGYPAESGLTSVTIVTEDGTLADGLSTSLFIMGEEKAAAFWKVHSDEFDVILVSDDGTLYVTEGIEDDFTSQGAEVEVIRK